MKSSKMSSGANTVDNGEKVIKGAQKNIAKVLKTSPQTVGKMSADEKLMNKVNKYSKKKMGKC
jgi:hypothetical protein